MKLMVKNISRIIFSLLLIVSIFGAINVIAETAVFKVTKIEVKEKSDRVTVNNVSVSANDILGFGSLSNDLTSATLNGSSTSFKKIGTSYYYVKSDATSAGSSIYTISNGVATIVSNGSYRGSW